MKNKNKIFTYLILSLSIMFLYSSNISAYNEPPISQSVYSNKKRIYVYPGGKPIGVKLKTEGALVVALSDLDGKNGKIISPAASGGIELGDTILKINQIPINCSEDISKCVNKFHGEKIEIAINRKGVLMTKTIEPAKSKDSDDYKLGLWVRDSTAGIGTLTFYDKKTGNFAALGHPITDIDTGEILKIKEGNIINSSIISVKKGEKGNPGELRGIFVDEDTSIGKILDNNECGIFGKATDEIITNKNNKLMQIAYRDEIKEGPAQILTTIDGGEPKLYDIKIEKLLEQSEPGPKSMIIKITDVELLKKTGGIVQGMSGSPIIQNGKLIGAVTHVLVNKPDSGYGIYIEWMIDKMNSISQ